MDCLEESNWLLPASRQILKAEMQEQQEVNNFVS
jgi:hypothetical protein